MIVDSIASEMFFSTFKVTTFVGSTKGSGTGFVFNYQIKNSTIPFLVTNKHVLKGAEKCSLIFNKVGNVGEPKLGDPAEIKFETLDQVWFGHPDPEIDLTVSLLGPFLTGFRTAHNFDVFYRGIPQNLVPSCIELAEFDSLENVVFVGYPNGIWDEKNLLPVIRRGSTATPLSVDFNGKRQFLIDASVFGGSSGSPVFIYDKGMVADRKGNVRIGQRLHFVGVVTAVFIRQDQNEVTQDNIPTTISSFVRSIEMLDLGIVLKSSLVKDTCDAFVAAHPEQFSNIIG